MKILTSVAPRHTLALSFVSHSEDSQCRLYFTSLWLHYEGRLAGKLRGRRHG